MAAATKGKRRVTFRLAAPAAENVYLVGDFNRWEENETAMRPKPDGFWERVLMLQPGKYEYKFKIDGQWACDPDNPRRCKNTFGTDNSLLVVDAPGKRKGAGAR